MDYYSRESRGGAVGSKGYNFQDLCVIRYLFDYIENEQFENLTVEQINDFSIRLKNKEISVQVKSKHMTKAKLSDIQEKTNLDWTKDLVIIAPSWESCIDNMVQKKKELINAIETKRCKNQIDIIEMQLRKIIEQTGIDVDFVLNCSFNKHAVEEQREVDLYRIRKWLDNNFFECDENIVLDRLISYVSRQRENRGFIEKETLIEIVKNVGKRNIDIKEKVISTQNDIVLSNLNKEKVQIPAASINIENIILYIENKHFEQAYINLKNVENNFGKDFSQDKIWLLIMLHRWNEAKKVCDVILENKDILNSQWVFLYKGIIAFETKKYKDAFKYLNKYIVKFKNKTFEAALYLAKTQIILKRDLEQAKELLFFCKDVCDENPEIYFELSKLSPLHEAVEYLEKVIQLDEKNLKARYGLAERYRLMGLNKEAYNAYKIYFEGGVHESSWRELSGYIYCLLNLGKQEEAEAYITFFAKAFVESNENRLKDHESLVLMDFGKDSIYVISCMMINNCYRFETPIGQIVIPVRSTDNLLSDKNGIGVMPDWFLAMNENFKTEITGEEYDIEATWKSCFIVNYQNDFHYLKFKTYLLRNEIVALNHDWVEIVENEKIITPYVGLKIGEQLHYIEYIVKTAVDIHVFEYKTRIQVASNYCGMKSNSSFVKDEGYYQFKKILEQRNEFSWIAYSVNRKEMIEIRIPRKYIRFEYC